MNGWSERRTGPRVEFRKDVRVIWSGQMAGLVAQSVNLSPTGILLDAFTPEPCPVGADVFCDVALPSGSRLLRGRIAHTRIIASAKVGLGIQFVDLSPLIVAELRGVVEETDGPPERVRVQFEGMRQVVSARAYRTADGFRLETALPFLRAGAEVDIVSSEETPVSGKGRVRSVAFDPPANDGAPRLLIDVRLDLEVGVPAPTAVERTEVVRMMMPRERPGRRRRRAVALGGVGALGAAAAIAVWGGRPSSPELSLTRLLRRPASAAVAPAAARAPSSPLPAVATQASAAPIVVSEASPEPSVEPAHFRMPLVGSLAEAVRYPLRGPEGVAFNFPHARPTVRVGTYRPDVAGIRTIWVRALPGGGTHLRFLFDPGAAPPDVELGIDGIEVTAH
jgi:hypothetical protein